jgi:hypothetical protein
MPDQLDVCADEQILLQRIGAGDNSAFEAFNKKTTIHGCFALFCG